MTDEPSLRRDIDSRSAFHAAIHEALGAAAATNAREIVMCDPDFADWPLGERACVERFQSWAMSHRRLTLLARTFDELPRRHARWLAWRTQWSHVVSCRQADPEDAAAVPSLIVVDGVMTVRLAHPQHHRGVVSRERSDWLQSLELIDAVLQRSSEALPPTLLGL